MNKIILCFFHLQFVSLCVFKYFQIKGFKVEICLKKICKKVILSINLNVLNLDKYISGKKATFKWCSFYQIHNHIVMDK